MFNVFMEAVERKYQEDPEKYGGKPKQAKSHPNLPAGAVVVTAKSGGAGFVCAADLRVKKVAPGGLSAAAGLKVGMQLAGFTAGGRRHAMGGVSWPAFKELCKQSPYPRVFSFVLADDDGAGKQRLSSVPIPEGVADRPPRKAKDAAHVDQAGAKAAEEAKAEQKRIQRASAEAQAEAKRKEEEEVSAQAEAAAQMRSREEAKLKAEEAAAKAAAKEAEEAAAKAAAQAAQAAQEAKRREAEAAEQEKQAREARLKPSGPVNVYISPLM